MGGELQETEVAPTSTGVTGSGYDPAGRTQSGSGGEYAVLGNAPPSPPVVVNVYPPEPSTPEDDEGGYGSPYMYRDPYASTYSGGILPGYFPAYGVFRSRGAFTPPGSGNHFRRSHGDDGRRSCSRLGPNYVPIGPAIGFDTYYRHTRAGFRR
jgi:hypothetical protein